MNSRAKEATDYQAYEPTCEQTTFQLRCVSMALTWASIPDLDLRIVLSLDGEWPPRSL